MKLAILRAMAFLFMAHTLSPLGQAQSLELRRLTGGTLQLKVEPRLERCQFNCCLP